MKILFNKEILNSYSKLERFLESKDTAEEMLSAKDRSRSHVLRPCYAPLNTKWSLCQLTTAPFRLTLEVFFRTIGKLLKAANDLERAKYFSNIGKRLSIGFRKWDDTTPFKIFLLKEWENKASPDALDVVLHSMIERKSIHDSRVKSLLFPNQNVVFRRTGLCRGMTHWQLKLYLQTKNKFNHPRDQMLALGKIFAKGAPKQAALLQSLFKIRKLIHLREGKARLSIPLKWEGKLKEVGRNKVSLNCPGNKGELRIKALKKMTKKIEALPCGAYDLFVPFHAMTFIKVKKDLAFFGDSNRGLMEIQGEPASIILALCKQYLYLDKDLTKRALAFESKAGPKFTSPMRQIHFQEVRLS